MFTVENDSDPMTDYFENDSIRVAPTHPLYAAVNAAWEAQEAKAIRRHEKYKERQAARRAVPLSQMYSAENINNGGLI